MLHLRCNRHFLSKAVGPGGDVWPSWARRKDDTTVWKDRRMTSVWGVLRAFVKLAYVGKWKRFHDPKCLMVFVSENDDDIGNVLGSYVIVVLSQVPHGSISGGSCGVVVPCFQAACGQTCRYSAPIDVISRLLKLTTCSVVQCRGDEIHGLANTVVTVITIITVSIPMNMCPILRLVPSLGPIITIMVSAYRNVPAICQPILSALCTYLDLRNSALFISNGSAC